MNQPQSRSLRILSDEEVLHWLEHNARKLTQPDLNEQDRRLLSMQVSLCTELMERRHAARSEKPARFEAQGFALAARVLQSDLYEKLDAKERAECDEFLRRGLKA
jgi:hypothetical protein